MKIITRLLLLPAMVLGFATGAMAQATATSSPYSMYGYGLIGDRATSMQRQMGGVGYAMNSGRQINAMNPAAYAAIDSLTFLFDIGADVSFIHRSENGKYDNTMGGGLNYITMQFPISKFMGGSIGLLPYSSTGYSFGGEIAHGTKANRGTGGINEAYLGLSAKVGGFSVGANVSYDFGNIQKDIYSTPSQGNSLFEQIIEVRDWNVWAGVQYTGRIRESHRITLGAVYSPKKSFHGSSYVTVQELNQESKPDTVGYMKLNRNFYQPNTIGGGINYTFEKGGRFMAEADFTWQDWSKASYPAIYDKDDTSKLLVQGMKFNDRYNMALGLEYVPRYRGNYIQRIAYRLGGNYCRDYLAIQGNELRDFGLSCGLGLPTPEGKTLINIGFEWRHRFTTPKRLVTENYFNITVGVNFNELWFWQRKIQ